jgi:two-component system copper resistance phosphate regulon response regulator CusR
MGNVRLLLIEDETQTAKAVVEWLESEGLSVSWALDGAQGLQRLRSDKFDVVVVDWMVPQLSGLDVLKILRSEGNKTPVLLLTARDSLEDRVQGLDEGADDYLVKPFALAELAARLRALIRRGSHSGGSPKIWKIDDLEVSEFTQTVRKDEAVIDLTVKEFEILALLLRNANRIVSRETLAREVWNGMRRATPLDNVIDVHIANLRRKLRDDQRLIRTVRGVGFILRSVQP